MPDAAAPARATRLDRVCFAAAFALTAAWFLVFDHCRPDYLVDEAGHLGNIYHFLEGKPGWPEQMTMLPGYHYVVMALWKLHPPLKLLTLARLVAAVSGLVALAAFASAWRRLHAQPAGGPTLLLALLPILQPYTGLAYTDMPALACVLVGAAAQLSGRHVFATLAFAAAALVRQTTLVWPAFFVAVELLREGATAREKLIRVRWLAGGLVIAAGAFLLAGRLTPGSQTGGTLHPNPAAPHFAGLLVLALGLPVWLAHAPAALRRGRDALASRPRLVWFGIGLGVAGATALALTFRNPHVWNRELFWDGGKFTLLRNWPLVWLDTHPWLRAASGLNAVLIAAVLALGFAGQPHRRGLWLGFAAGALLPFTHSLIEPRYFLDGAVLVLLFVELPVADLHRLGAWWLLICFAHAPFIARGVSLW